jgi:hypothetical protein
VFSVPDPSGKSLAVSWSRVAIEARDGRQDDLRGKTHFVSVFNSMVAVSSSCAKISLSFLQKLCFASRIPPHRKGRTRVVTNVEAGCDGHDRLRATSATDVDGEVAWSWPPGAEAKLVMLLTGVADDRGKTAGPWGERV